LKLKTLKNLTDNEIKKILKIENKKNKTETKRNNEKTKIKLKLLTTKKEINNQKTKQIIKKKISYYTTNM
jgi:hypothetical protein